MIIEEHDACAFDLREFVLVKQEYRAYKSCGRSGDTPVYRIVLVDSPGYYELRNMQTNKEGYWYEEDELLPLKQED